jgi:hypothetical protein
MRTLLVAFSVAFALGSGSMRLSAKPAPTIGAPTVAPSTIAAGAPSVVTVTVPITDPAPIPNGANLIRLGPGGSQSAILGQLHDDGVNGDAIAGDKVYSIRALFSEPTAGQIQLQISAAFQGQLKRVMSPVSQVVVSPAWYNASWMQRQPITVTGSPAGAQTNYQVKLTIPHAAGMKENYDDVRFTASDGVTALSYWIESEAYSTPAIVWVKIPSIPAYPAAATIYLYYGNSAALAMSNGEGTFDLFDTSGSGATPGDWNYSFNSIAACGKSPNAQPQTVTPGNVSASFH